MKGLELRSSQLASLFMAVPSRSDLREAAGQVLLGKLSVKEVTCDVDEREALQELVHLLQAAHVANLTRVIGNGSSVGSITLAQFNALATLMRSDDRIRPAALALLVYGWSSATLREHTNLTHQSIYNLRRRFLGWHHRVVIEFNQATFLGMRNSTLPYLTHAQFDLISGFMRARGNAQASARMVLVFGRSKQAAADDAGVTVQACWNAVQRYLRNWGLIVDAYGVRP